MNKLRLVIGATLREQMRWASEHLYLLLILTPLIFGISYASVSRLASDAPAWQPSLGLALVIFATLILSLIVLSLTRTTVEVYHLRKPESFLDSLPVSISTQLHVALLKRIVRTTFVAIVILTIRALAGFGKGIDLLSVLALLVLVLVISVTEILSAISWIHWGHVRNGFAAVSAIIALVNTSIVAAVLLILVFKPTLVPGSLGRGLFLYIVIWIPTLYVLTRLLHKRWRSTDIEYAKRLQTGGGMSFFRMRFLRRRFSSSIAMQVARDLQLTLRGFSSAVYVALFLFASLLLFMITALSTSWLSTINKSPGWFATTWHLPVMATKVVCVLATASCSILVAVLVAYQLPYYWLERVAGTTGKQMWDFKLPTPTWAGVMATAGGLVFSGSNEGNFFALDAANGKPLWQFQTGGAIRSGPMSFLVGDKQYVAVAGGHALFVFGLGE